MPNSKLKYDLFLCLHIWQVYEYLSAFVVANMNILSSDFSRWLCSPLILHIITGVTKWQCSMSILLDFSVCTGAIRLNIYTNRFFIYYMFQNRYLMHCLLILNRSLLILKSNVYKWYMVLIYILFSSSFSIFCIKRQTLLVIDKNLFKIFILLLVSSKKVKCVKKNPPYVYQAGI